MPTLVGSVSERNDVFRSSGIGFMVTQGAQELPNTIGLIDAIRKFDDFTGDNDPNGEHDFGSLVWFDNLVYWKIDYYDQQMTYWKDPLSKECHRVLTVMLASEY